jgi:protein subunit release factor B
MSSAIFARLKKGRTVVKCNKVCETLQKAYGESAMKKTNVYKCYKRFQDGHEDVEDDEHSGRPSTSIIDENVKKLEKMVTNDRRITIREAADEVGISIGSCHNIFSNVLGM